MKNVQTFDGSLAGPGAKFITFFDAIVSVNQMQNSVLELMSFLFARCHARKFLQPNETE